MSGRFSVEAIFTATDRLSRPVAKMADRVENMSTRMTKSLKTVDGVLGKMRGGLMVGVKALAAGGALAGFGISKVVEAGAEFEQAITNVGAVSLMSRDEIAELEKKALELGANTTFSATEVANAMEMMGKAGFDNGQILQGIEGILSAAAAEGAGLEETASNISNVLKGMNLDVGESGRVANVLTLASARTNSSISSLAESMKNASATAAQFKIPLEDTVGAVALLQDVGLDASEAGTAFATMLTKLAKPTDSVAGRMHAMGVKFQDAKGNMLPLNQVLWNMAKAAQKSGGNMKQAAFFADLVGLRGQKAAIKLKDLLMSGKVAQLTEELGKASEGLGKAKEMAELRRGTLLGDWENFTGAIETVAIEMFKMESGPLRDLVSGMTDWVEANQGLMLEKVESAIVSIKDKLPEFVHWLGDSYDNLMAVYSVVRDSLPAWDQAVKTAWFWIKALFWLSAAVKAAQAAMVVWRTAVIAYNALTWMSGRATAWATKTIAAQTIAKIENATATELANVANADLAKAMSAWGAEATTAGGAFAALRTRLQAGPIATAINGITGKLGQAGLLGAALLVGVAIGSWLNETFDLDTKISGWIAKMTGIEKQLDAAGGRAKGQGVDEKEDKYFADGTVVGADGTMKVKGSEWQKHVRPLAGPQIVPPQERTAQAIQNSSESTSTEKVEITIKDPSGSASVKRGKTPAKGASLNLDHSGAF